MRQVQDGSRVLAPPQMLLDVGANGWLCGSPGLPVPSSPVTPNLPRALLEASGSLGSFQPLLPSAALRPQGIQEDP